MVYFRNNEMMTPKTIAEERAWILHEALAKAPDNELTRQVHERYYLPAVEAQFHTKPTEVDRQSLSKISSKTNKTATPSTGTSIRSTKKTKQSANTPQSSLPRYNPNGTFVVPVRHVERYRPLKDDLLDDVDRHLKTILGLDETVAYDNEMYDWYRAERFRRESRIGVRFQNAVDHMFRDRKASSGVYKKAEWTPEAFFAIQVPPKKGFAKLKEKLTKEKKEKPRSDSVKGDEEQHQRPAVLSQVIEEVEEEESQPQVAHCKVHKPNRSDDTTSIHTSRMRTSSESSKPLSIFRARAQSSAPSSASIHSRRPQITGPVMHLGNSSVISLADAGSIGHYPTSSTQQQSSRYTEFETPRRPPPIPLYPAGPIATPFPIHTMPIENKKIAVGSTRAPRKVKSKSNENDRNERERPRSRSFSGYANELDTILMEYAKQQEEEALVKGRPPRPQRPVPRAPGSPIDVNRIRLISRRTSVDYGDEDDDDNLDELTREARGVARKVGEEWGYMG
ncbi:hypothetical protein D9758_010518 [Tetrapyrgos nigripes]|uniref:Uncharacterized protein n=1 Tax=Tetrapyrgos nigripes TaxID=182062 RepID=A0A8H5CZK6_9AGAR|nr:hypothetical protein D9758_010518 [Tetrapyrgos nigripes]